MTDRTIGAVILMLAGACFAPLALHREPVESTADQELVAYIPPTPTERPTPTPEPTKAPSPTPTEAPTATPEPTRAPDAMPTVAPKDAVIVDGEELQLVYMTCYLPTGNCCADGTPPHPGVCASAPWRIGQDCILYRQDTLEPITRLECRDTGGHPMLQAGTAIDVFVTDMAAAWSWVGEYGTHVYIKWVEREQ